MLKKIYKNASFFTEIKPYINKLNEMIFSLEKNFSVIYNDINSYVNNTRKCRGAFNFLGLIWKAITGNLDSSDEEYYNKVSQE